MEQVMTNATAANRLYLVLVGLFAAIAATLAAIGLYGVVSYIVLQRTREIGIRVALGARRQSIVVLIVRQGMQPAMVGLTLGVIVAAAASKYLESVLYGVRPHDPVVMLVATVLMIVVALIAIVAPALRASSIEPARALTME
jgi:ABC-type antimicrobial peptide transport system permease subunit